MIFLIFLSFYFLVHWRNYFDVLAWQNIRRKWGKNLAMLFTDLQHLNFNPENVLMELLLEVQEKSIDFSILLVWAVSRRDEARSFHQLFKKPAALESVMGELKKGIESATAHDELAPRMAALYAICRLAPVEARKAPIRWMISQPDPDIPASMGIAMRTEAFSLFRTVNRTPADMEMKNAVHSYFRMAYRQSQAGLLSKDEYQSVDVLRQLAVGDDTWEPKADLPMDCYWRARLPMEPGPSVESHSSAKLVLAIPQQINTVGD